MLRLERVKGNGTSWESDVVGDRAVSVRGYDLSETWTRYLAINKQPSLSGPTLLWPRMGHEAIWITAK